MCPTGRELAILDRTATKIVDHYVTTGDICPKDLKTGRSRLLKVSFGDQMLMEMLINTSGTTSLHEIQKEMELYGDCSHVSLVCLSNHVK